MSVGGLFNSLFQSLLHDKEYNETYTDNLFIGERVRTDEDTKYNTCVCVIMCIIIIIVPVGPATNTHAHTRKSYGSKLQDQNSAREAVIVNEASP